MVALAAFLAVRSPAPASAQTVVGGRNIESATMTVGDIHTIGTLDFYRVVLGLGDVVQLGVAHRRRLGHRQTSGTLYISHPETLMD